VCKGHACGYLWKSGYEMSLIEIDLSFIKDKSISILILRRILELETKFN
jgi:hypothetical protein